MLLTLNDSSVSGIFLLLRCSRLPAALHEDSANIDAAKEAARFGIGADRSVNYKCDEAGTALNYEVISEAVCSVRAARPLSADWKRRIDEDVQKRGR